MAKLQLVLDPEEAKVVHKPTQTMVKCTWKEEAERKNVVAGCVGNSGLVESTSKYGSASIYRSSHVEELEKNRSNPHHNAKDVVDVEKN